MEHITSILINATNPVVICPIDYKRAILKAFNQNNILKHVVFFTEDSFIDAHSFKSKPQIHALLSDTFNIMPDNTNEILSLLKVINIDTNYDQEIFNFLKTIKMKALDEGWIEPHRFVLNHPSIFLLGYKAPSSTLTHILNAYSYEQLDEHVFNTPLYFKTLPDDISEAVFIAEHISFLIHKGISLNHIKIHLGSHSDEVVLKLIFNRYNLPLYFKDGYTLGQLHFIHHLIDDDVLSLNTIYESIEEIKKRLESNITIYHEQGSHILQTFLTIMNPYIVLKGKLIQYKTQLFYDLAHANISYPQKTNQIMVGQLIENYIHPLDHVFVFGMNANEIPKTFQNNCYLDDSLRHLLHVPNSFELTRNEKIKTTAFFSRVSHLYITSKESRQGQRLYPSPLINQLNRPIHAFYDLENSLRFSMKQDQIDFSKHLYMFETYQVKDRSFMMLYPHYIDKQLAPFDSQLKTLEASTFTPILEKNFALSYTKLNSYFECPFKFLFQHLLKIDPFDGPTFSLHLGNFFHLVLKDYVDLPIEESELLDVLKRHLDMFIKDTHIKDLEYQFFLNESLKQLIEVILFLKSIDASSDLSYIETEKRIELNIDGLYIKKLVGVIDKIVSDDVHLNQLYIVDYKTGNPKKPLDYLTSGLYAQLMFYLLFLIKRPNHPVILGFYYQNIFSKVQNQEKDKSYKDILKKQYQLHGYSNEDIHLVSQIDRDFKERKTFAKYSFKKDGTISKNSWAYSSDILYQTIYDFETLIHETVNKIESGIFPVEPVYLNGNFNEKIACDYCNFKDICYVKNKHFKNAPKMNPLTNGDTSDEDSE